MQQQALLTDLKMRARKISVKYFVFCLFLGTIKVVKTFKQSNFQFNYFLVALLLAISFLLVSFVILPSKNTTSPHAITADMISMPEGDGSQTSPYKITKNSELMWLSYQNNNVSNLQNAYISLEANLDMTGQNWEAIGNESSPFGGNIQGNGYTISNLALSGVSYAGLFGVTGMITIDHLNLSGVNFSATSYAGAFVAKASVANLTSCVVTSGTVSSTSSAGGLVGQGQVYASECSNNASVSGENYVGGIVGVLSTGTLDLVINYGAVNGTSYIGGIAGQSSSQMSRCINRGTLTGSSKIGGIVASLTNGTIDSCISHGNISFSTDRALREIGSFVSEGNGSVINSSAKVNITLSGISTNDSVLKFGAPDSITLSNSLSESNVQNNIKSTSYKKSYMVSSQTIDESKWFYDANRFDGMPIPSNIFWGLDGNTTSMTMTNYLTSKTFDQTKTPELQYNQTDNYYYYELGSYPQSHVSDELNTYLLDNRDSLVQHTSYNNYSYSNLAYEYQGEIYVDAYGSDFYHVEPLVWKLMNVDDYFNSGSDPLVTTIYSITGGIPYNDTSWTPSGNWAGNPPIKNWLNENFYNDAFTDIERSYIKTTLVGNQDNQQVETDIFLISRNQLNLMTEKRAYNTDYASKNGANNTYMLINISINRVYVFNNDDNSVSSITQNLRDSDKGIRPGLFLSIP